MHRDPTSILTLWGLETPLHWSLNAKETLFQSISSEKTFFIMITIMVKSLIHAGIAVNQHKVNLINKVHTPINTIRQPVSATLAADGLALPTHILWRPLRSLLVKHLWLLMLWKNPGILPFDAIDIVHDRWSIISFGVIFIKCSSSVRYVLYCGHQSIPTQTSHPRSGSSALAFLILVG